MSKNRPQWLLDGRTPVVELMDDDKWETPENSLGVLVAFPGTIKRKWVDRSRLVAYGAPEAQPEWEKAA